MEIVSAEQAEVLVDKTILQKSKHDFVVMQDKTQHRPFGWVVFYTTEKYLKTNNPSYLVPGVAPVVVERNGKMTPLPSSVSPAMAIANFELKWSEIHKQE